MPEPLKAPFPYFGGKRRIASTIWRYLGNVDNYIEPCCGSAAVLLLRPHPPRVETINDADHMVANFWRATRANPEAVVEHADMPVNESDLRAVHHWLVLSDDAAAFRRSMETDPDYHDPKVAGRWCWGLCCWIGGGWCSAARAEESCRPDLHGVGSGVTSGGWGRAKGVGIHHKRPPVGNSHGATGAQHRPQLADEYGRGRGVHSNDAAGTCAERRTWLLNWFDRLRDRLRSVRVCCGDWSRVCSSPSVTTRLGVTGVFLDPPYGDEGRAGGIYAHDSKNVAAEVLAWCLERGSDQKMRIALCGYEGEHDALEEIGWTAIAWRAHGGYGNRGGGNVNRDRERVWFSPACAGEGVSLFDQ